MYQAFPNVQPCFTNADCVGFVSQDGPTCCVSPQCVCGVQELGASGYVALFDIVGSDRVIIGADNSASMLKVATVAQPADVVKRVRPLQTSAFDIDLPDNAVDSIFCMRLMHHIGDPAHRLAILREFQRVTRDSVILSLWVDGNFKAWKRKLAEVKRRKKGEQDGYQNRFVLPAVTVEKEFEAAGFRIQEQLDFIPLYAMWRVYVLRKR